MLLEKYKNGFGESSDHHCSHCGKPVMPERIDGKYVLKEIGNLLFFEKGIFFTIRELVISPGKRIREFITKDRNRLIKPIIFIITTSLIYSLCNQIFDFEDRYISYSKNDGNYTIRIFDWISANYGYANILMAVFIALWLRLFFRKSGYNFFEILILLCYLMGIGMLLFAVCGILETILHVRLLAIGSFISFVYISWSIMLFYQKN